MHARFDMEWVPPEQVRGNSRAHWRTKARRVQEMRESGLAHGLEVISASGDTMWPLRGNLSLSVKATVKRWMDGDNLLIGYKGFIDGLADAGVLMDDKQISFWGINVEVGKDERSVIVLAQI